VPTFSGSQDEVLNKSGFQIVAQIGGDCHDLTELKCQSKKLTDSRPWPRGLVHVREARGHHWFRRRRAS